jgi:hypothetical protein
VSVHIRRKFLARLAFSSAALLFAYAPVRAYGAPQAPAADSTQSATSQPDVRALADAVRDLQTQVRSLTAQLEEMRSQQQQTLQESEELRRQLAAKLPEPRATDTSSSRTATSTLTPVPPSYSTVPSSPHADAGPTASLSAADPASAPTPITPAPTTSAQQQESSEATDRIEEEIQLINAKLNDQYQTKVESGSKYHLRLSGIVLLNAFSNRGTVDNIDFPELAQPPQFLQSNTSLGGSLRQSQLTVSAFGPDVAGAHTSANVSFDFAGGFPDTENGASMGLVRLRTGTIRFDWTDTSIIVGQDSLFLSPIAPTSLAMIAVPALSYSGNLWSWTPQIRVEHQIHLTESSALHFQAGLLDSYTGDIPQSYVDRDPMWGEQSGQPAYAARISWSHHLFGRDITAGIGGYFGRQNWYFGRDVDGWAGTSDLTVPLGKFFDFSAEFYRGTAVGGLGGGVGQTVLFSGAITDPSTMVQGLKSMGGWTQIKFKPKPKFEVNGAFGQDNPFASQVNLFPAADNTSYYEGTPFIDRNRSAFVNFIYQPRSDLLFAIEYRRLRTFYLGGQSDDANHVNMSVGYIF